MNSIFNQRQDPNSERLSMVEHPGKSAVQCLQAHESALAGRLGIPDKEEVMRMTQPMKREFWRPDKSCRFEWQIMYDYLAEWDHAIFREIRRFGITRNHLNSWVQKGWIESERLIGKGANGGVLTVYRLPEFA